MRIANGTAYRTAAALLVATLSYLPTTELEDFPSRCDAILMGRRGGISRTRLPDRSTTVESAALVRFHRTDGKRGTLFLQHASHK